MTEALLKRLHQRISNMLGRGRLTKLSDVGTIQTAQVDEGPQGPNGPLYLHDDVPVMGLFGVMSVPPTGADAMLIFLGGDRAKAAILGHNHQASRPKSQEAGSSGLYDIRGLYIWRTAAGLTIDAGSLPLVIQNASAVTITASGAVTVNAPTINLGGTGGAGVARIGDTVSGGVITGGSTKVKAT